MRAYILEMIAPYVSEVTSFPEVTAVAVRVAASGGFDMSSGRAQTRADLPYACAATGQRPSRRNRGCIARSIAIMRRMCDHGMASAFVKP